MSTDELAALYERRYHRFLRVTEGIVGDAELAQDVVQDAFARLVMRRNEFRAEGAFEGWVWRTVVNAALNARRDCPHSWAELDESQVPSANGQAPDASVRALVASLPERQRVVLFLRYYADLDYHGIAEALEIQPGTVGATLNQARSALKRLLEVPR